jgi:hypothetical protein
LRLGRQGSLSRPACLGRGRDLHRACAYLFLALPANAGPGGGAWLPPSSAKAASPRRGLRRSASSPIPNWMALLGEVINPTFADLGIPDSVRGENALITVLATGDREVSDEGCRSRAGGRPVNLGADSLSAAAPSRSAPQDGCLSQQHRPDDMDDVALDLQPTTHARCIGGNRYC